MSDEWLAPPCTLTLPFGEVHVWRTELDVNELQESITRTVSPDEIVRASRFRFQRDQVRFLACRGVLRSILARYLECGQADISFSYESSGKPKVAAPARGQSLEFNLSHSGGYAVYAVAFKKRVGIDLEQFRADISYEQIAKQFFSPEERDHIRSLPESRRLAAFFFIWTRKEAYVKATGEGLSVPLDSFSVAAPNIYPSFTPGKVRDRYSGGHWSLRDLEAFPGCAAALVVEESLPLIRCWQWTNKSNESRDI